MPRLIKRRSKKAGLPPGTIVHIGEKKDKKVKITVMDYSAKEFTEKEVKDAAECSKYRKRPTVTWINVNGIHQTKVIEKLGKCFGLHPLLLEDIVNTDQRPKLEDYGDYLFIVLKMLYYHEQEKIVVAEQISIVLGPDFVISFQEDEGDVFGPVRERIRNGKGRTRESGADFLTYNLIDAIVDNYFIILEKMGGRVEGVEEELVKSPTQKTLGIIHQLKREMLFLRKSVWPLREVINGLLREESKLVRKSTKIYLRDVYDHTIQVIDTVETYRDMLSGMIDIYLSSISNKLNEVMKVLTIIGTIFIPLTFITGLYGMNFRHMPELEVPVAYPAVLFIMLVLAIIMLIYFRRRKWL